jgi:hypothetical protein
MILPYNYQYLRYCSKSLKYRLKGTKYLILDLILHSKMLQKRPILIKQQRALQQWAHCTTPKPSHKQRIELFFKKYGHWLSKAIYKRIQV